MPISLGDLASSQSKVKEKIMEAKTYLINYTANHMSVKMQYHKSIMMIYIIVMDSISLHPKHIS